MEAKSQRPKDRKGAILVLNATIEAVNLAKEISSITPATAAFTAVSILLTMLKVCPVVFCSHVFQIHAYPGLNDQRTGSRRYRVVLRRHLQSA